MLRTKRSLLLGVSTALLLSACGATPKTTKAPIKAPVQQQVKQVEEVTEVSAETLINEAQQSWQQNGDVNRRNSYLFDAAQVYLDNHQPAQAAQVVFMLKDQLASVPQTNRYNLLLAQIYSSDDKVSSKQRLALLASVQTDDAELNSLKYALMANEYARLGQWPAAANAILDSASDNPDNITQAWEWINRSSDKQIAASSQFKQLAPYAALRQLILDFGFEPQQLQQQIAQYQQVYRGHPLVTHWPQDLRELEQLSPLSREKIVVMLPLSGRLQVTGMAIKEGIMAGYFSDPGTMNATIIPTLHFVDTNDASPDELAMQAADADWIIGPLLKETVDALLPKLNANSRILTLNRPETLPSDTQQILVPGDPITSAELTPANFSSQIYYALAPEDEARQLAERVFSQGRRSPIIVASENTLHQRMQEAYLQRWVQLTRGLAVNQHNQPTLVTYTDNATLRDGILDALDVAQSKERISEMQSFADTELYNLPRNRRDIDAIVIFTSPEQTELVNPVIEASISPFGGETVPVFATSRSVDYAQSRNQWRDLENLHFLDMPWVLPDNPAPALATQTEQLWPQRPTPLQRLFAFGVDAYNLLPRLNSLVKLPQLRYQGLTGALSVNKDNEIVRTLPEAVISQERVNILSE